jgi:hypothetical protein
MLINLGRSIPTWARKPGIYCPKKPYRIKQPVTIASEVPTDLRVASIKAKTRRTPKTIS